MSVVKQFPLEEEYKKKTGITRQDILKLRDWVQTQPHLPADYITDLDLILTYHSSGRSAEVTKQLLDLHFTLRTLFTSTFKDRRVDDRILTGISTICLLPLKMRSHGGSAVLYTHLIDLDVKKFVCADVVRACVMVLDLWQYEEGTWPGLIICVDMEWITLAHVARLDLHSLQEFFYYLQEAMFVNLKGLHFLNAPSFMDKVLMLIRPFLQRHLLDMLYVHQVGSNTLEKTLPHDALPRGDALREARDEIINKMKANSEYFVQESHKRVVEARRPGKPKTITDIFGGVEGSFKKLEID